jgi:hypothetical protein
MDPGLPFADLQAYNADGTNHQKRWFGENATALDLACDVAGDGSVRNLLTHIFATELFFANRVHDLPKADHNHLPHATLDELFAIHSEAHRKFLAKATVEEWATPASLGFRDFKASKRARWSRRPSGTALIIAASWPPFSVSRDSSRTGSTTS